MISFPALKALLNTNVCEVRFDRRHLKPGALLSRKALISNCAPFLTSQLGREILHWRPPIGRGLKYNPDSYGLIVTWDILWQDYRQFDGYSADLIQSYQVITDEQRNTFWDMFMENFINMTPIQKLQYMNS